MKPENKPLAYYREFTVSFSGRSFCAQQSEESIEFENQLTKLVSGDNGIGEKKKGYTALKEDVYLSEFFHYF